MFLCQAYSFLYPFQQPTISDFNSISCQIFFENRLFEQSKHITIKKHLVDASKMYYGLLKM